MFRRIFIFILLLTNACRAAESPRRFDWPSDTFAFSNDTLWVYDIDAQGVLTSRIREKPPEYSRCCFVMCRATLQFFKFVRFAPEKARVSDAEYRRLVRKISRVPVWLLASPRKIEVPGYSDLHAFSKTHTHVLQAELGHWWPSYFRLGNWRMAMPFPRIWQRKLSREFIAKIDRGKIQAAFMTRFRPINHCVIVYGYKRLANGDIQFLSYDPNDVSAPRVLLFKNADSSFYLDRTSYFNGGRVNVFKSYIAPWQ